jgi:hypothetical protein
MSLPIPFKRYIPRLYWDDPNSDILADKADAHLEEWKLDICRLSWLYQPERCPSELLNELGAWMNAGIAPGDSDDSKRKKILTAVQGHKRRGSWTQDVKPKIDTVAGGDSSLLSSPSNNGDWILLGGTEYPETYYWATMAGDGTDDSLGLVLIGSALELGVAGNIYIDVDNASLTPAEVAEIVFTLELDIVPAYYKVHIGYIDGGGAFVEYALIQ